MSTTVRIPIINNAAPVLLKKIESLQAANKCLQLDRRMRTKQMLVYKHMSDLAKQKLDLSNRLIELYTEQISCFTSERETQAHQIYDEIEKLDHPSEEFIHMMDELRDLECEFQASKATVDTINNAIPEQMQIEQVYETVPGPCGK